MKLVGLLPFRNEAYCLGLSARVALMWCDALVMLNHASTDGSDDIAIELSMNSARFNVVVIDEPDPKWDEMRHRQTMLETARTIGATHIAIIDADEILTGNLLPAVGSVANSRSEREVNYGGVRQRIQNLPTDGILELPGHNLRGSLDRFHSIGLWANRWFSAAFKDDPALRWTGDRFHSRAPVGPRLTSYRPIAQGQGGIMHLWGASERRLRAKHAAYKVTERLRWPAKSVAAIDGMYNLWNSDTSESWKYATVPPEWWAPYKDLMKYLDVEAVPWQEQFVREKVELFGAEMFKGLDLFGIV